MGSSDTAFPWLGANRAERRLAAMGPAAVVLAATVVPQARHWFLLPVAACGFLVGLDAIAWARGRLPVFDAAALAGLVGCHFFFLAPLLHVVKGYYSPAIPSPPPDWRPWLGAMAGLDAAGLLAYRLGRAHRSAPRELLPWTRWELDRTRLALGLGAAFLASAALQAFLYVRFGGLSGYITGTMGVEGEIATRGMGPLFTCAEAAPGILLAAIFLLPPRGWLAERRWVLAVSMVAFLAVKLACGGLRGSRSNLVFGVLWAVMLVHDQVRQVPRKLLAAGAVGLVAFAYFYGFFKAVGPEGLAAITDGAVRAELVKRSGRSIDYVLFGDLGRSDVQAVLLYRFATRPVDLGWGRTYLTAFTNLIPRRLWPSRPPGKAREGTNILFGSGSFDPRGRWATNQYGLAGEAMLNFGPAAVPFAFFVLGAAVAGLRRLGTVLAAHDPRCLFLPLLALMVPVALAADLENVVLLLVKEAALPFVVIVAARIATPR